MSRDLLGNNRANERLEAVPLDPQSKRPNPLNQLAHDWIGRAQVAEAAFDLRRREAHAVHQLLISIHNGLRSGSESAISLMLDLSPASSARRSQSRASSSRPIWQA